MFNKFPYTDFHEINLDWILAQIKKLNHDMSEFEALNTITNAGLWNITEQYPAWTIVSDNNIGYISIQPVPAGVLLTNTDYWLQIADFNFIITDLEGRISALESQMVTANANITKLLKGFDRLRGKKVGVYADSWGGNYPEWIYQTWRNAGVEGFNHSYGGYTMKSIYENLVDGDAETADVYIIMGGINDWNGQVDPLVTVDYQQRIIQSIAAKSPHAEIYFMLMPRGLTRNNPATEDYCQDWYRLALYLHAFNNPTQIKCSILDCNCISQFKISADGLHPDYSDNTFMDYFGDMVSQFICNGGTPFYNREVVGYTSSLGAVTFHVYEQALSWRPSTVTLSSGNITIATTAFDKTHLAPTLPSIFAIPDSGTLKNGYLVAGTGQLTGEVMGSSVTGNVNTYNTTEFKFRVII